MFSRPTALAVLQIKMARSDCNVSCAAGGSSAKLNHFVYNTLEFFSNFKRGCKNCLVISKGCEQGKRLRTTDIVVPQAILRVLFIRNLLKQRVNGFKLKFKRNSIMETEMRKTSFPNECFLNCLINSFNVSFAFLIRSESSKNK